jgi:hypothetical protein
MAATAAIHGSVRGVMAHVNKVLRSINDEGATRCVDLFRRPDGSCGFEEYRRDVEDGRGWFPVGNFSQRRFDDQSSTLAAALEAVPWLETARNSN